MAAGLRLHQIFFWLLICCCLTFVLASPAVVSVADTSVILPRDVKPIIRNTTGEIIIIDPTTRQEIPQGPATDGSGANFSPPAIIWLGFCLVVGLPMACAGIRGWRLTIGTGIGLTTAVCGWAGVINTVNDVGVPDLVLIAVVLGFFFLGFTLGLFNFARLGGIVLIAIVGGLSIGIRIILLKDDLLLTGDNLFAVNWAIIAVLGAAMGLLVIPFQRIAILAGCTSIGTFLTFLGVDLILNKQSGMSRGLRFLFDRNSNHLRDIITNGYKPPISTQILIGLSLALIPALAYAQHRVFKQPFNRKPVESDSELGIDFPTGSPEPKRSMMSGLWEGAKLKAPSRFSL